jgi:MFS family permease
MNAFQSAWVRFRDRPAPGEAKTRARSFAILFWVSAVVALGNTGMQSVLPAIGRQIGIPDPLVAAIFSLSALLWALSSPYWAKRSDRVGRKPMIVVGLSGFMVSMICCGAVVSVGVRHWLVPLTIFALFLLARALFGLFGSAANPASQAYVAERTTREERTQAMSTLAGAFGLGTIMGPLLATMFVLPVVGLAGPMFAFAAMAGIMLVVVMRFLPEKRGAAGALTPDQARLVPAEAEARSPASWRDRRLTPFLIYGFLVSMCQNALGQTLGFLIIDKIHQSPMQSLDYIRMAMMSGAIASLLGQWGLVRMFRMSPRHLLRWGAGLATGGALLIALSPDYWTVVIAYAVSSLGFAFARPGFTAAASLAVSEREQAGAAGAIAVVNGVNVIFAPLFVRFYQSAHAAPFLLSAAILVGLLVYAYVNPTLRAAGEAATSEEAATVSILERGEEGGAG